MDNAHSRIVILYKSDRHPIDAEAMSKGQYEKLDVEEQAEVKLR
jgi:hypothetical protein